MRRGVGLGLSLSLACFGKEERFVSNLDKIYQFTQQKWFNNLMNREPEVHSPEAYNTENHSHIPELVPRKCVSFPVKPEGGKRCGGDYRHTNDSLIWVSSTLLVFIAELFYPCDLVFMHIGLLGKIFAGSQPPMPLSLGI